MYVQIVLGITQMQELEYVSDTQPGIRRIRRGKGFFYKMPCGKPVQNNILEDRINRLAIPPAYENVWICLSEKGHIQATGLDARKRKQYRYHPYWEEYRSRQKFENLIGFGEALSPIRRKVRADLKEEAGSLHYTLAAMVSLLQVVPMRVGNKTYTKENETYGVTTLRDRHLDLEEGLVKFDYKAKGGKRVRRILRNKRLNKILENISDLPGKELFTYRNRLGEFSAIDSSTLNEYLATISRNDKITAKTFRTWAGTLAAFKQARQMISDNEMPTIKAISQASAETLFNTPTISRASYIHPKVIELADKDSDVVEKLNAIDKLQNPTSELQKDENSLLNYLKA